MKCQMNIAENVEIYKQSAPCVQNAKKTYRRYAMYVGKKH
jgi:hypothetical protein